MALLWALVHQTFEEAVGDEFPIVVHTFMGRTKKEAVGYFNAHMKTDSFIRGCTNSGRFDGFKCRTVARIYRYDTKTRQLSEP